MPLILFPFFCSTSNVFLGSAWELRISDNFLMASVFLHQDVCLSSTNGGMRQKVSIFKRLQTKQCSLVCYLTHTTLENLEMFVPQLLLLFLLLLDRGFSFSATFSKESKKQKKKIEKYISLNSIRIVWLRSSFCHFLATPTPWQSKKAI